MKLNIKNLIRPQSIINLRQQPSWGGGKSHQQCFICESENIELLRNYESHGLIRCNTCSFVFMKNIPSKEELEAHYEAYPYDTDQFLSPLTIEAYEILCKKFEMYRQTNNILDVGCGQGWLLDIAMQHNWKCYGTEFSKIAFRKCADKGIIMAEGVLNTNNYAKESFDVIILSEVIEHINNPLEELNKIFSLLRKGGLLYITTPNFNGYLRYQLKDKYNIIGYPEHLGYFTRKTLNDVLKRSGFKKIKLETTGVSLSRYQSSVNTEKPEIMDSSSKDERLRVLMSKGPVMKLIKNIVNLLLTITGLGLSLKAYYIKR